MPPRTASASPADEADVLSHVLRNDSSGVAIIYGDRSWNWRALTARVRAAAGMLHGFGVQAGDRVAFAGRASVEHLEVALACAWIGAVFVPVDVRLSAVAVADLLTDCRPSALVASIDDARKLLGVPRALRRAVIEIEYDYERFLADAVAVPRAELDGGQPFCQLYTAGTAAGLKGVVLSHAAIDAACEALGSATKLGAGSVSMVTAPLSGAAALVHALAALRQGASTVLMPIPSTETLLGAVEKFQVTHTFALPSLVGAMSAGAAATGSDLSSLRCLLYGSSPVPPSVVHACATTPLGTSMNQLYGCTETAGVLTVLGAAEHREAARLASVGRPLPGVCLRITDPLSGAEVPVGEPGLVEVHTPHTMSRYWDRPEQTATTLSDSGWLRVGDIGFLDADGYLYLVDRANDLIIRGGDVLYPGKIERVLCEHPLIVDAALVAVHDEQLGDMAIAFVVPAAGATARLQEGLNSFCQERLLPNERPCGYRFVDALPRGDSGRVLRGRLV